jgi:phosphoglycolate phosphatase
MHLIFDFDGTLVDSFNCVMEKSLLLADEFNIRKLDKEEIQSLRDLTSIEIIKYLQIPTYKIPKLIYQIRKYLQTEMRGLKPIPEIPEVLKKLSNAGFTMGILTSNSAENVRVWLDEHHLQHFFDFTHIESCFFSKKNVLRKTLKLHQSDKSKVLYIGDETRDIDAATQNNINAIAVTWGYNSEKALLQYKPLHIARKPDDILKICGLVN